jgi:hypothetical protein
MKSFIILILSVIFISLSISAQDFKLNSAGASLGKGSVSSGYDIVLTFKDSISQQTFSVIGNHTRMYVAYCLPGSTVNLLASGGFNQNAPWIGPKVTVKVCNFVSTMHWLAIAAGEPGKPAWKAKLLFGFNAVYV